MTFGPGRETTIRAALVVMGVVTTTPALALLDPAALGSAYGVRDPDPMTLALLQHRGMMQLVLGAGLIWAAFLPPVRLAVALGAVTTKSTFLALVLSDAALRTQVIPNAVFDSACIILLTALAAHEVAALRASRASRASPGRRRD
jgi:hypothetical protein